METILIRVKTVANFKLPDDVYVAECMDLLKEKYPQITDYNFERVGDRHINIMFWGDNLTLEEKNLPL